MIMEINAQHSWKTQAETGRTTQLCLKRWYNDCPITSFIKKKKKVKFQHRIRKIMSYSIIMGRLQNILPLNSIKKQESLG